jgi:[protein-PII] uridylyltransferase
MATAVLDDLGLTIADARIIALKNGFSLSTYVVLEQTGEPIGETSRLREQIRHRLDQALAGSTQSMVKVTRRAPRQVRMFTTPTLVSFTRDEANQRTVMELVAGDQPGLLCQVGQLLRDRKVAIQTAKILTLGERAEDVFYITDDTGQPLSSSLCRELQEALTEALDHPH